jgi:hypothetical protein
MTEGLSTPITAVEGLADHMERGKLVGVGHPVDVGALWCLRARITA